MTPSVAASTTVVTAALLAGVSTAVHDRAWWAEEAVHAGTDWYGVVTAALEMMSAAGITGEPAPDTITAWDGPSGVRPPPNITAIGRAVSLSRSSRSDWSVCAGSWRQHFAGALL
jgi:hypothetical protein